MPHVIFLHGTSSSGKTTLAKALQAAAPLPFWHVSSDQLVEAGLLPNHQSIRADFDWKTHRPRFFNAFHGCVKAILDADNHMILDHIIESRDWYQQLRQHLTGHRVFIVGLHCSVKALRERELQRSDRHTGNRYTGEAEYHLQHVHSYCRYDFEINTQDNNPQHAAKIILNAWTESQTDSDKPSAFFD